MKLKSIDYVIFFVTDLEASAKFYEEVIGLEIKHKAEDYAQFESGKIKFGLYTRRALNELIGIELISPAEMKASSEIGFIVDDIDSVYRELVGKGAAAIANPTERHWGQTTAYISDPDGNLIELIQN